MVRYAHPVDARTYDSSDPFGSMKGRTAPHKGSDYKVGTGTTVKSPSGGTVIVTQWSHDLGNVVGIAFDDDMFGGFAHNEEFLVSEGDRVELGTAISLSDNTGAASSGPHLHFSLGSTEGAIFGEGYGSTLVDAWRYVQNHLAGTAGADGIPFDDTQPKEQDMTTQYRQVTDELAAAIGIHGNDWLIRDTPAAELRWVTQGQAADALFADGIADAPFSHPNVAGKSGAWVLAALLEDATARAVNVRLHPWLADGTDPALIVKTIKDAIDSIHLDASVSKEDRDLIAKAVADEEAARLKS